jgi:hypothetical protein
MSRDSSCRPSELLKLRIKDVAFKVVSDRQYAEILVNGKTGTRHIPLINCLPYLKDWLDDHPLKNYPNAYLFAKRNGSNITSGGVLNSYKTRIRPYFENLLNSDIDSNDKKHIKELLKKPWNPYIRRHSALTDKSKILKEHVLRQHAGWSISSRMPEKYLHYFGNESNEAILEAYGLKPSAHQIDKLAPKQCPNCSESCKIDDRFCPKCRMVLSYDAYTETIEQKERQSDRLAEMEERQKKIELWIQSQIDSGQLKAKDHTE